MFNTLNEVKEITDNWVNEYNLERPHESLGNLTPVEYLRAKQLEFSKLVWD
ncbi:MAG: putative transposase [Desulforhopalus sp.]|jgi:putative transposase